MNEAAGTTTLQPNDGGLQNGQTNLQPQSLNNNTQSTGALQQNALGPDAYRNFDSLRVQTEVLQPTDQATATGKNTPEIFFGVFVLLLIAAIITFVKYRNIAVKAEKIVDVPASDTQVEVNGQEKNEVVTSSSRVALTKKTKKKPTNKKPIKKKSTGAKRKKK